MTEVTMGRMVAEWVLDGGGSGATGGGWNRLGTGDVYRQDEAEADEVVYIYSVRVCVQQREWIVWTDVPSAHRLFFWR